MASPSDREPLEGNPKYEKVMDLGKGGFGTVQLCRNRSTGELVAIKFMKRGDKITRHVENEIINHSTLVHPHVIRFMEVFLTPYDLGIVMEYAAGGNMYQYVKKHKQLPEDVARWFFQQIIVALDYCHRMGVANRDVKLENTLLDASACPLVKICDFGCSKNEIFQSAAKSIVGTPAYLAPEIIVRPAGDKYDGKAVDVWSCGVMLYVMLVGQYPFDPPKDTGKDNDGKRVLMQRLIERLATASFQVPRGVELSAECHNLLGRMLVADPTQRITMNEIFCHPWYTKTLNAETMQELFDLNKRAMQHRVSQESLRQVKQILEEARRPSLPNMPGVATESDEFISFAIDHCGDASSISYSSS